MGLFDSSGGSGLAGKVIKFDLGNELVTALLKALGLDDSSVGGAFDKSYVSGYEYYAGLHIGVCHGPVDKVLEVTFRGKTGWKGVAAPGLLVSSAPGYAHNIPTDQEHPTSGGDDITIPDVIVVNKANLFGGEHEEGGVLGIIDVLHGTQTQGINTYLDTKLRPATAPPGERQAYTPGYRGILSMVFHSNITSYKDYVSKDWIRFFSPSIFLNRQAKLSEPATHHTGFYWGAMNPTLKEVGVRAFRALQGWNSPGGCWYPEKAVVIRDGLEFMNVAHVVVQCMLDLRFGMKVSPTQIGESFRKCADQLHHTPYVDQYGNTKNGEAVGVGIVWWGEESVREFISKMMAYVDGNVYLDPLTGLFEMNLIRQVPDDQVENLPMLGPSQIIDFGTFSRPIGEEAVNSITVMYTSYEDEKTEAVTRSNTAMTSIYGSTISDTLQFPGVKSRTLAAELCERAVRTRCSLAGRYQGMRISRLAPTPGGSGKAAFTFVEGSPFRLNYPEHGINGQVFRVANINYKTLEDNWVEFDAVEDSFSLTDSPYIGTAPGSGWVNLNQLPSQFSLGELRFIRTPYVTALLSGGTSLLASLPQEMRLFTVLASRDDRGVTQAFDVWTGVSSTAVKLASGEICPTSELDGELPILDNQIGNTGVLRTTVKMKNMSLVSEATAEGAWFYVDDEAIRCVSIVDDPEDSDYLLMTLERGVYETVPAAHADGAKMWWFNGTAGARYSGTAYQTAFPAQVAVLPSGRLGSPSLDGTTALLPYPGVVTEQALWPAPYPAAAVSQGGVLLNRNCLIKPVIEWAGRDKTTQSDVAIAWDQPGLPTEDGVYYEIEVYRKFTDDSPETPGASILLGSYTATLEGPAGFLYVPSSVAYTLSGYPTMSQQYYDILFHIKASKAGFSSATFVYETEWLVGYNYGYGYGYGGMTDGVALQSPGDSLSQVDYVNTRCPKPIWARDRWIHNDGFLKDAEASGGLAAAPSAAMPFYYAYGAMQDFSIASGYDLPATEYQAKICCSIGSGTSHRVGFITTGRTGVSFSKTQALAAQVDVGYSAGNCYSLPVLFDFVTHDGTTIVAVANKGSEVFTLPVASVAPGAMFTRAGTNGVANPVSSLLQVEFIKKFGSTYVAVGGLLTDYTKTGVATSADLVTWTLSAASYPARAMNPWAWQYYPPTSEYFIFDTVGDPSAGGGTRVFRTTNGYTFTVSQIGLSSYAPCAGNALIYYMVNSGSPTHKIEVFGGGKVATSLDGATWSVSRSTKSTLQVGDQASWMYEPFTQTYPGAGAYADDSPTTRIALEARKALVRVGGAQFNQRLPDSHPGFYYGGALVDLYNRQTASPETPKHLISYGGCLPDWADESMYDSGFASGGTSAVEVHGIAGVTSSAVRYFEVSIGRLAGICAIGVVASAAAGEVTGVTSLLVRENGSLSTDMILDPSDGLSPGAGPDIVGTGITSLDGVVASFLYDGVNSSLKIFLDGDTTPVKIVTGIDTTLAWFPVFAATAAELHANLGQVGFQFDSLRVSLSASPWVQ